jgi:hypothetical protein
MGTSEHVNAIKNMAAASTKLMQQSHSEIALRTAVELMLTDHDTVDVIEILKTTAQFLEDRR